LHACVTPASRSQAAEDNAAAADRLNRQLELLPRRVRVARGGARRRAEQAGRDVGSLSLAEIAAAARVSRSTLLRRAGGRAVIDAALRERVRAPVTLADRVVAAAGALIAAGGVGALTLERVAGQAGCT